MNFSIRKVSGSDAAGMLQYSKVIGGETEYLNFGEEGIGLSIEEEKEILEKFGSSEDQIMFIAEADNEIVGSIGFAAGNRSRIAHVGEFGMAVKKDYWGVGVGSGLIDALINWCQAQGSIRKVNLRVRTDNKRAIALYLKKGFEIEGTCKMEIRVGENYFDQYLMGCILPERKAEPVAGGNATRRRSQAHLSFHVRP